MVAVLGLDSYTQCFIISNLMLFSNVSEEIGNFALKTYHILKPWLSVVLSATPTSKKVLETVENRRKEIFRLE